MSTSNTILRIAIASPLRRLFDYLPDKDYPQGTWQPGLRVSVPFGKQKAVTGIVIETASESTTPVNKLRKIHTLLDQQGLTQDILQLCQWCANYYHYPLGEACHLALPAILRKTDPCPERNQPTQWQLTDAGKKCEPESFGRAKKQYMAWQLALEHHILTPERIKDAGINRTIINTLVDKGILKIAEATTSTPSVIANAALPLNQEQQHALDRIHFDRFHTYLLDGVTGSGKTEIYLQAIQAVIEQGKQALVLVPEIGLTPQTLSRFEQRFNVPVATVNSAMTDRQRLDTWLAAKAGDAPIIVGTRSAVFTPLPNIGLIVVDEEHDLSYKQQEGVRYSARELAIIRGHKNAIPVILGSATASLESLHNALSGRFEHLQLNQRATKATLPIIRCVDQPKQEPLAPEILQAIKTTLDKQQQVLLFINRRGYSPTLMCQECGWLSQCSRCDSRMTVHHFQQHRQYLHCHHCDYKTQVPTHCPHCHSSGLLPLGQGTQRLEETLLHHFQNTPVVRIDRDSMSRKGQMAETLDKIYQTQACIVVGTQMLAKGHHFPNMSLAVILGLDNSFFSSDFRGAERMAQLLTQVAGRAGREQHQGQVLIQTQFANHPHLQTVIDSGYGALAKQLLSERQLCDMPPYHHLAFIRCHAQQPSIAMEFLQQVRHLAQQCQQPSTELQYLGPMASAMEKRNNRYYYQLQVKAKERKVLHGLLHQLLPHVESLRPPKGLHWLVDVDPQES